MPMELRKGETEWSLGLSGTVDIFDAAALHAAALDAAVNAPSGVIAKLEGVESVDTAATQVLLALKAALVSDGRALTLTDVPAAVFEFWLAAGFPETL